jgi:gluconolactonase
MRIGFVVGITFALAAGPSLGCTRDAVDADGGAPHDARASDDDAGAVDARVPSLDAARVDGGLPPDGGSARDGGVRIDAGPVDPIGITSVARVASGHEFTEGPQWIASRGVLVFSDIPRATIHELTPPVSVAPYDTSSGQSNGLALGVDGQLLRAEHGGRRIARERDDGSWETLADRYLGDALHSPNDLVVASDGTIYFTDPEYGRGSRAAELDFVGIYRLETDRALIAEVMLPLGRTPNGIALSPDESILYVAKTGEDRVDRYPVGEDGSLGEVMTPGWTIDGPDGMAVDEAGNLYVASRDGIVVFAPDGTEWDTIAIDEWPTNCAFGGADRQTLYVTAGGGIYRVSGLLVPGVI